MPREIKSRQTEPQSPGLAKEGSFDFGTAIRLLRAGLKVSRAGWNGKGMFIYYVGPGSYPAKSEAAKGFFGANSLVPYRAYIAMKTVDNSVVPWIASQTDLLSEDWFISQ